MGRLTFIGIILSVALLFVLVFWGPGAWFSLSLKVSAYGDTVYAVYLDTGHIFYGKLRTVTRSTLVLTDVQSFQKMTVGESANNTLEAQVANPLTRPENFLVLNRSHVLFFEKVGQDSPILRAAGTQ